MNRYAQLFESLGNDGAFVPFVVAGDPDVARGIEILSTLAANGADILEIGLPFSDPTADGPVIQLANGRALSSRPGPGAAWEILSEIRRRHPRIPLGLLVYANLVESAGLRNFYTKARESGVDSVLVADVPTIEARPFLDAARNEGIAPVLIAAGNTPREHLEFIARESEGFTYVVSRAGVTGADREAAWDHGNLMARLQGFNAPPALLGFGISTPAHVRHALASGARGAIAGSATVRLIERHQEDPQALLRALAAFTQDMKSATFSG